MQQVEFYQQQGFVVFEQVFNSKQLDALESLLMRFHQSWQQANWAFYQETAINSAHLTAKKHLADPDRFHLFEFISQDAILNLAQHFVQNPAFLNTQLFFDPANPDKQNYWHRDIQYDADIDKQMQMLGGSSTMPHFRIPLHDEKGVEVVPGTHKRWDTEQEWEVRMSLNGRQPHHDLPGSEVISLKRGDLLVFSAKMLHRGIYGNDRFAFDLLLVEGDSPYLATTPEECLPDSLMLERLSNSIVFQRSIKART